MYQVAIDGPSGAGKSTLSKEIAKNLGFIYVDTGAMYRAAALACLRQGVDINREPKQAAAVVKEIRIDIDYGENGQQLVFLNGEDVSDSIRVPEVSIGASDVSKIPEVRKKLVSLQQLIAQKHSVVMDGRDIGTVVLPEASVKIFLTASLEDRAKRRFEELKLKGMDCQYEDVLQDMSYRDKNDSERDCAPLRPAEGSILLDTSGNSFHESLELLLKIIRERLGV